MYLKIASIVFIISIVIWYLIPFSYKARKLVILKWFNETIYSNLLKEIKDSFGYFLAFIFFHYMLLGIAIYVISLIWPGLILFGIMALIYSLFIKNKKRLT